MSITKCKTNFLNFCTIYSSEGDVNKKLSKEACFSTIFHMNVKTPEITNTYTLKIYNTPRELNEYQHNNCCFLCERDIKKYINSCKKYAKFTYNLKTIDNYYLLTFKLTANLLTHKFVLSYFRYLYECPYSVILFETFKVKQQCSELKHLSYLNLFNLIGATYPYYGHGASIHGIGKFYDIKLPLSDTQIQQCLNTDDCDYLNDIFPVADDCDGFNYKDFIKHQEDYKTTDMWKSKSLRLQRIQNYIKNYNYIKNFNE